MAPKLPETTEKNCKNMQSSTTVLQASPKKAQKKKATEHTPTRPTSYPTSDSEVHDREPTPQPIPDPNLRTLSEIRQHIYPTDLEDWKGQEQTSERVLNQKWLHQNLIQ